MFVGTTFFGSFELAVLVKLVLAGVAGAMVGLEREKHGRPAGLRTHLLVSLGACLMMIISEAFFLKYGGVDGTLSPVRLDPSRVAAQIVAGIGFIGAGVILKEGVSIRGLTTAASLWLIAGVGMAFGMGLFGAGAMATVLALFSLVFLKRLDPVIKKDRFLYLTIVSGLETDIFPELERVFAERQMRISDLVSSTDLIIGEVEYQFVLTQHRHRMGREMTQAITALPGVRRVSYK
ncbi:MAG: MgtC/SapB family protein [Desulfuromonadales bacterium]|nr:MgtC/SapB family protein [Desulfuromonadales bacterium]